MDEEVVKIASIVIDKAENGYTIHIRMNDMNYTSFIFVTVEEVLAFLETNLD